MKTLRGAEGEEKFLVNQNLLLNLHPRPCKGWSPYRHAEYFLKRQGRMQNKPAGQLSRSCHYVEIL